MARFLRDRFAGRPAEIVLLGYPNNIRSSVLTRSRRLRRLTQRLHRWAALATGIVLLVVVLSGVALVLAPEIERALSPGLYRATATSHPIPPERAAAVVERELPGFEPADVIWSHGVWEVLDGGALRHANVDPGSGQLLGTASRGAGVLGFLRNLHMCGLSCEGYAGRVGLFAKPVPVLGNDGLTVGGLILALAALVLLGLCLSGIVLWWPGIRRLARGFRVRRGNGRYAINYDLHKVAGVAAIPFLAMWAITGMGFELKQVEQAWYGLLPGKAPREIAFASGAKPGRGVTMREARLIAERRMPDARLIAVSVPDRSDQASYYSVTFSRGEDPYDHYQYAGNTVVAVDRYSGRARVTYSDHGPLSQELWEEWNFPVHAGSPVSGWWRTAWIVLGLAPLLLAITGVTTWWMRRRKRRRKRVAEPIAERPRVAA